jgi:predicted nucleic acid-binding protein
MGASRLTESVADAGPLIHLAEVGQLDLLAVFSRVHIPGAVWSETVGAGRVDSCEIESGRPKVQLHDLDPVSEMFLSGEDDLSHLQRGEVEALWLARKLAVPLILTDDLAVRDVCRQRSVTPVGSLGIVVRACRRGLISIGQAERCLIRLHRESSLFVSAAIVEIALAQLRSALGG